MIVKILRSFFVICFVTSLVIVGTSNKIMALYPTAPEIVKPTKPISLYVGANLGTALSNTFGVSSTEYGYSGLYTPTRFLTGGLFALSFGSIIKDTVRVEAEYIHIYQEYPILSDDNIDTKPTNSTDAYQSLQNTLYGKETMDRALAINVIYDFKNFSRNVYPYLGLGVGNGEYEVYYVDSTLDMKSGLGEKYCLDDSSNIDSCDKQVRGNFLQAFVGMGYEAKFLPVLFTLEYRYIMGPKLTVYPKNGDNGQVRDGKNQWEYQVGSPVDKRYSNHSIDFSVRVLF